MYAFNVSLKRCNTLYEDYVEVLKSKKTIYILECEEYKKKDEEDSCAICLNNFQGSVYKTICNHNFHTQCIKKCIKLDIINCPLCKTELFDSI